MELIATLSPQDKMDIAEYTAQKLYVLINEKQMEGREDPSEIISIKEWAEANGYTAETFIERARERHIPITQYPKNRKQFGVEARYKYELLKK